MLDQLAILKQGVDVWNEWRRQNSEKSIYLSRANLKNARLKGANLTNVHLDGAKLSGADLRRADLTGADLTGADLTGANLQAANLSRANLSRANLTRADLRAIRMHSAVLTDAILIEANLREADLRGTTLNAADFTSAHLYRADLRYTDHWEAKFDVDLQRVALLKDPPEIGLVRGRGLYSPVDHIPPPLADPCEVFFTAIYPKEARIKAWHTLMVYAHLQSAIEDVRRDADRFKDQIRVPKQGTSAAFTPITRGTELTIIPSWKGVVFNPEQVTFKWVEDYHRADFRFKVAQSLSNVAAGGEINIYVGPILIGSLEFAMFLNETDLSDNEISSGAMYHQEEIFVSYSHKDSDVVLACKEVYDALGFNILIDVDTLRSGQVWNAQLMHMIQRATIFQLFWSQNSAASQYCRQEWEYALEQDKDGFIRPVYWEVPMPKPPDELGEYHFEYRKHLPKRKWWSSLF
jgi:hypothetical protein